VISIDEESKMNPKKTTPNNQTRNKYVMQEQEAKAAVVLLVVY